MSLAHGTDPLQASAVRDDEQVVVGARVGIPPEALDARQEVVERRDSVGADRISRPTQRLHDRDDAKRRPERVRVRVLMAHGQDASRIAQARHDDVRHGREERGEVHGHQRLRESPRRRRARGFGGITADGGSDDASPS